MTKTLTEQRKKKELKDGDYYVLNKGGDIVCDYYIETLGHFDSVLTENVKGVLAPVPSYDEYKRLVSNSDELVQKIHILNEQNTKQYNELCEEIKKNNILEKKLDIATKALKKLKNPEKDYLDYIIDKDGNKIDLRSIKIAAKALKEMRGVK